MAPILVAVDFSRSSRKALQVALRLARTSQSSIRLVHVVPRSLASLTVEPSLGKSIPQRFEKELDDFAVEELNNEPGDLPSIDRAVLGGVEAEEITSEAKRCGASMIVMGTHGRSVLGRVFLGSVSTEVVGLSTCPVLIVPESARSDIRRILAAVDRDASVKPVLEAADSLARALKAHLAIAHVFDDRPEPFLYRFEIVAAAAEQMDRDRAETLREFNDAVARVFQPEAAPNVLLLNGKPEFEILREAVDGAYDLVVAGTHEKHEALDFTNTTMRLVHRCPTCVLIVPPPAEKVATRHAA
jgi:nucleotide-binding universal stress UspA family protein